MNAKKGIASSVSFVITPKMRSGSVRRSGHERLMAPPECGASSTPTTKNTSPTAASEKATG